METELRREDAANRRVALCSMASGDHRRAIGWARLVINDDHRLALLEEIARTPTARDDALRAIVEEEQAIEDAVERARQNRNAGDRSNAPRQSAGQDKARVVVPVIEPSPALALELDRLLARKMKGGR